MNNKEAIILAGGTGTRLRSAVPGLPKCMAPVAGKPFLSYVIDHFLQQGIERFIFSLGYMHEAIEHFLHTSYPKVKLHYSIEEELLGTGGAIKLACTQVTGKTVLVVNGDTLFKINLAKLWDFHHTSQAQCTLSLKPMKNFERYGVVELNEKNVVTTFCEKQFYESGYINGGVYTLDAPAFLSEELPEKFSFEKDYLEQFYTKRTICGVVQDEYFIDIGIPEDYEKANAEF